MKRRGSLADNVWKADNYEVCTVIDTNRFINDELLPMTDKLMVQQAFRQGNPMELRFTLAQPPISVSTTLTAIQTAAKSKKGIQIGLEVVRFKQIDASKLIRPVWQNMLESLKEEFGWEELNEEEMMPRHYDSISTYKMNKYEFQLNHRPTKKYEFGCEVTEGGRNYSAAMGTTADGLDDIDDELTLMERNFGQVLDTANIDEIYSLLDLLGHVPADKRRAVKAIGRYSLFADDFGDNLF